MADYPKDQSKIPGGLAGGAASGMCGDLLALLPCYVFLHSPKLEKIFTKDSSNFLEQFI